MNLLGTIFTLSVIMTSGASLRVKHATRRRDLQGARRPQPRFALSLDGTWVLAPETTRGAPRFAKRSPSQQRPSFHQRTS